MICHLSVGLLADNQVPEQAVVQDQMPTPEAEAIEETVQETKEV